MVKQSELVEDFTIVDLFKAYYDCRRNKRCTHSAMLFEMNLERNLMKLYKDLKSGNYKIGRSICFVVTRPKPREVWAANFRDRIVHHLVYNAISPRFYKRFIADTYSCIPKRGTLAAAKRLLHFTRSATNNYKKPMYCLKADLSNFFVSIDREILFELLKKEVKEQWLLDLIYQIIFNNPTQNVFKKSSFKQYELIPKHKSLFFADNKHGLPIGNLSSQFFSNVYLNEMDKYIKQTLQCRYYMRYVDDFIIVHESVKELNKYFQDIKNFIDAMLCINLNPRKKLINFVAHGIDFVGFYIKPNRIFLRNTTVRKIFLAIKMWKCAWGRFNNVILTAFFRTMNSYFGMLVNLSSFRLRVDIGWQINSLFIHPDCLFTKCVLS